MKGPNVSDESGRLKARVKVWYEGPAGYSFGYGLIAILQAIEETGSFKSAAENLGRSYRHIWDRVKGAETALGIVLVESHVGGKETRRSRLSQAGKALVADFLVLRERMIRALDEDGREGPLRS